MTGASSSCPDQSGPPASRASWQTTAARFAAGAPPGDGELTGDATEFFGVFGDPRRAANASSGAAGKRSSGAWR